MQEPDANEEQHDPHSEISRMHGNTLVRTLRRIYGADFAANFGETNSLTEALPKLDEPSLAKLVADYEDGVLADKIAAHG